MSDLSPSQKAFHHIVEELAYAITSANCLAKYETADSMEDLIRDVRRRVTTATVDLDKAEALASEARAARLKVFG